MFGMHLAGALGRAVIPDLTVPDLVIPTLMVKVLPPLPPGFSSPRRWPPLCRPSTLSAAKFRYDH
jgi:hypothetical protein